MDTKSAPEVAVKKRFVKRASGKAKSALPEVVWEPDLDSLDQARFLSFLRASSFPKTIPTFRYLAISALLGAITRGDLLLRGILGCGLLDHRIEQRQVGRVEIRDDVPCLAVP